MNRNRIFENIEVVYSKRGFLYRDYITPWLHKNAKTMKTGPFCLRMHEDITVILNKKRADGPVFMYCIVQIEIAGEGLAMMLV